eukprot:scaffold674_cov126-Cylindrotheca_fusiformis.AAC.27
MVACTQYVCLFFRLVLIINTNILFRARATNDAESESICSLYLAKSTIENAGIGVFTAVPLQSGENVGNGDVCIPIKDLEWQNEDTEYDIMGFANPFADYVWYGDPLGMKQEIGPFQRISAFWPGLNAAVNCHPAMLNTERATPRYDNFDDSLHRSKDPSVGSFSPYHNGSSVVTHFIPAGGELFTSYGDRWFEMRLEKFPPNFPVPSSFEQAQRFLQRFKRHVKVPEDQQLVYDFIIHEIRNHIWTGSRFLHALPNDFESVEMALEHGLRSLFQENATRSVDWLREHGACIDNILPGRSTISTAGRGAFAKRFLVKGSTITASPLIHMVNSEVLDMHQFYFDMDAKTFAKAGKVAPQLVKNYCLGHNDTTILLCPYGSGVNYINHNQSLVNVRLAWPQDGTLNHEAKWLNTPLADWRPHDKKTRLAIEYIAIRDISPGEELFLDYGDEWEKAYLDHVEAWNPPPEFTDYVSAASWNLKHNRQDVLRTPEEVAEQPYPDNLQLRCHGGLSSAWGHKYHALTWDENLDKYNPEYGHECSVIRRHEERSTGKIMYDVNITEITEGDSGEVVLEYERRRVPRSTMKWFDKPETTDMHLPNAFRHAIEIPDDIFPDAWRITPRQPDVPLSSKEATGLPECDMYLAESTIPNAGLGLFTTKPLSRGDFVGNGDVAILSTEVDWHNQEDDEEPAEFFDMTHNYVWDGKSFGLTNEVLGDVHVFWPGINAAVNFNPFLVNVDSSAVPDFDDAGLHRSTHPGAGAFSTYHKGIPRASRNIPAGGELFKDYGISWFHERDKPYMPGLDDIQDAQYLLYQFFYVVGEREDVYNLILDIRGIWPSRLLNALPGSYSDGQTAALGEIADVFQPNATRSVQWLEETGRCMDHIVPGTSTLENAGHGAFAKRFLPKGTVISGSPVIHMLKEVLEMYDLVYAKATATRRRPWNKSGYQLLLNYCFGHDESRLLLCPYGSGVNYINHNASLANVRIQWAPNGTVGHNSSWLSLTPDEMEWNYKQNLAIDYIATKNIEEGEELFLDYGPFWEVAWMEHLRKWKPKKESSSYLSAAAMNQIMAGNPLRSEDEQREQPYPYNVMLQCDRAMIPEVKYVGWVPVNDLHPCTILERNDHPPRGRNYKVRINIREGEKIEEHYISREGIQFYDRPYTSDLHIRPTFRHSIGLPVDMVPSAWLDSQSSLFFATKESAPPPQAQTDEL